MRSEPGLIERERELAQLRSDYEDSLDARDRRDREKEMADREIESREWSVRP